MRVDENIELRWENMLAGVRQQAGWLAHGPRELLEQARELLTGPPPPAIYLTGCGDSHYEGLATRHAFESWSGIPTQALPALERVVAMCGHETLPCPARKLELVVYELAALRRRQRDGRTG